ncbi:GLPGLI family protein [Chryseobacterium turcicum]|uniref:GLPGLI family protein n=1 Tax=Chryseobacterium turcicum TaxID=2898076 RepID=A0A9Q3V2R8_9FLAO|nr:GLPGLI family protein [Chryseobacterium turcicum]MCD1115615.1 GLPGLI family protein [Chryseobacterium turcicum]
MKLNFSLILAFLTFLNLSAQGNRFTYEYQFRIDSTKTDSLKKEFTNLDIFPTKSYFYGQAKFASDSIMNNSIIQQRKSTPNSISYSSTTDEWNISYLIEKSYPSFKTTWLTNIEETNMIVEETPVLKWQILPETQKIENYNCQKATANFGGRIWEAWFSKDLPFPDGPYKFHGLPGLIVKLEDKTKSHQFLLKGSKKLKADDHSWEYISALEKEAKNEFQGVKVSPAQYKKLFMAYKNDPAKDIKLDLANPNNSMTVTTESGTKLASNAEIIKYFEESLAQKYKTINNQLELNLHRK